MITVFSGRLLAAEILKVRTTRAWWLFLGGFLMFSLLMAAFGWASNHNVLYPPLSDYPPGPSRDGVLAQAASARTPAGAAAMAVSMMTSGQVVSMLIAVLLGVHVITSECTARTLTPTFLVEPRRGRVVAAKLAASVSFGVAFWAMAAVVNGVVTPVFLATQHQPSSAFTSPVVMRAVLMGLLGFVLWAAFGLGLGAVIRSQAIAVAAAIGIYAAGFVVVEGIVHLLATFLHADWLLGWAVLAPPEASSVMLTAGRAFPHAPPWWAGALVLAGYGVALTVAGSVALKRADVSLARLDAGPARTSG